MQAPTLKPVIDVSQLWMLLGIPDGPERCRSGTVTESRAQDGHIEEEIRLETARGPVPGTMFRPSGPGPHPAILYCHAHGNRHDIGRRELREGRTALPGGAYGPLLAHRGYTVFCIDMPGFGDRQTEGSESALAKAAHWKGRTLFGLMLADLSAALDYLTERPDIDAGRIATFGISMGATHAYWLAALDARVARTAHLCAFSNIAGLIEAGTHDLHGPYMTVPGLLARCDMGHVAAMIAPRPQFIGAGGTDPLTPPAGLRPALETVRDAYERVGASDRLTVLVSPETGHVETPEMHKAILDIFT